MQLIFKHIVTSITLVCFLTATGGLNLTEHHCSAKGKSFLFLNAQDANCGVHGCSPETCCLPDCCKNFKHFAQLDAGFFSTHHDLKIEIYPILYTLYVSNVKSIAYLNCRAFYCPALLSEIGLPVQLRIKQTTEFLL